MEKIPYFGQTLIRWNVGDSTFLALPEKGARLMNWSIQLPDGSVRDVIHWPEVKTLDDFHKVRGGNPILFPFCGRSFDKGEIGFWRDAKGVRRPMPMHGLARQGEFRTARIDANGFDAVFVPGAEAADYVYAGRKCARVPGWLRVQELTRGRGSRRYGWRVSVNLFHP